MSAANFEVALAEVLKHEGGYVNDKHDPGGETNYGITKGTARDNGYTGAMRSIPMEFVRRVYRRSYWDAVAGDALPSGVDLAVFDFAVNSGVFRASQFLQRIVNVIDDGQIGPKTLASVHARNAAETADELCDARLFWLQGLKLSARYGRGWTRRVRDVQATAVLWAGQEPEVTGIGQSYSGRVTEPEPEAPLMNVDVLSPETQALQWELVQEGYLPELNDRGLSSADGYLGPATHSALKDREQDLAEQPAPAKPWWTSHAVIGSVATVATTVAGLAGYAIDAGALTEVATHVAAIAFGLIALWGSIARKRPIDKTLVARIGTRDVRLPVGVPGDAVPARPRAQYADARGQFADPG